MTTTMEKPPRKRAARNQYTSMEKTQAVLALWTEKARPSDLCRDLKVNYMVLNHWQERALEGMMQALSGRVDLSQGSVLSSRLQTLLEKRQQSTGVIKLEKRLEKLQEETRAARKPLRPAQDLSRAESRDKTEA